MFIVKAEPTTLSHRNVAYVYIYIIAGNLIEMFGQKTDDTTRIVVGFRTLLKVGFNSIQWWVSCRYAEEFCSPMFVSTGYLVRHDQTIEVKIELKHVKVRYATAQAC